MASYNRVILAGNLTRDPQLSYLPSGTPVCKFGLAVNRRWKDKEGGLREEVCFVDCTAFAARAETFNQYMAKGRQVLIEGRLQFSQWTTPEGEKRSKHEVVVDNFTFLGGVRAEATQGGGAPATADSTGPGYDSPPPPSDEDIPF